MSARLPIREAWERRVQMARSELARARDEVQYSGTGRLLLNIKADVELDVVVERTAPTSYGYSLSGRIEGGAGGFVTLVVHAQAVAASIWTPAASYEVAYLGGRVHVLREVMNEPQIECAGAEHPELATSRETAQSGVDDGSVVDVLVVWTPAAEDGYGGEMQMKAQIELAIAYTNDILERSGALVSLNLVGTQKVDYDEADVGDEPDIRWPALRRLADPADGHMDGIHALRDTLGADLVSLVLDIRNAGLAFVPGSFSVSGGTSRAFAHEIGHNFGVGHDRSEGRSGPQPFGNASVGPSSSWVCWRTIMSNSNRCYAAGAWSPILPFYASPWRYLPSEGTPLGVSRFSNGRGPDGPADAVLQINQWRHRIASFRPSRSRAD